MDSEITVTRSIFSRSRNDQRRRQRIMDLYLEKENTINHLYNFKLEPQQSCTPAINETRPMPKSCDRCMTDSAMAPEDAKYLGLEDCFLPATMSSYNPTLTRIFPFYHHYSQMSKLIKLPKLPTFKQLEDDENLLSLYPEEMFDQPNMLNTTRNAILKEVRQLEVSNVWNVIYTAVFRFSAWLCQKLLSFQFESVLVHRAEIEYLRYINQTQLPIVYIPTFRSEWDKTLIVWALAHHGIRPPIFLCSHLGKSRLGKYFGVIGSSMKVKPDDKHSELRYSSALSLYLRHLLRNGNPLMVNLECRRSRTGRLTAEVFGSEILKIIYDEFANEKVEDVYFVPMSVSYELLPEAKDILASSSNGGNLFGPVLKFFKWFVTPGPPKGKVKIDFAKPFCLREFHRSMEKNAKIKNVHNGEIESYCRSRDCAYLRWGSSESLNSVSSIYGELFPLYPDEDQSQSTFLDVLNYHIMFDAGNCESVMPTHLLAFLLMKKHRNGVSLEDLKKDMDWLVKLLESNKKDFGFAIRDSDAESIIIRALESFNGDVRCEWIEELSTFMIKPSTEIQCLRKLDYYANYIFPEFAMKAIVGFLLHPSCMTVQGAIRKEVDRMSDDGLLTLQTTQRRVYHLEDLSEDEDFYLGEGQGVIGAQNDFSTVPDEIKIYTSSENYDKLSFLRNLTTSYLDLYAFLASTLKTLVDKENPGQSKEMLMSKFQELLLTKLHESENEFPNCRELLNKEIVKTFLGSCEDHHIVYCRIEAKTLFKFYGLDTGFNSEE